MKNFIKKYLPIVLSLIFCLAIFTFSASASGDKVYVSNEGSNTNGDGSEFNPYKTIKYAYENCPEGSTIVLLSDIEQSECVSIWHDIIIDGNGHYVIRQDDFETTSDDSRSWYNPAMFEIHPDENGTIATFKNIILDDDFKFEGTQRKDQPIMPADTSGNLNIVQDGIISLYSDPDGIHKSTVVLEERCAIQNFGGVNAVNLEGDSTLIMKSGSRITNNNQNPNGYNFTNAQAVLCLGGKLIMEKGSLINGIIGANAIFTNSGEAVINGEITDCQSVSPIRSTGNSIITVEKDAEIHNLRDCTVCAFYCYGGATTYNIDGKIYDITGRGGIWASNSNGHNVYITDNAELYNIPGQVIRTDLGNHFWMSGGKIYDSGIAIYTRKQAEVEISGGEITGNTYGVLLANDSTTTARNFIKADADIHDNEHDIYIQNNALGYMNRSYLYLDEDIIAKEIAIEMQLNDKTITPLLDKGFMYLGNASAASKTVLENEAANLGLNNILTTFWYRNDQNIAKFKIEGLILNTEPVFALYVEVDENGNPIGNVYNIKITDEIIAELSNGGSQTGYSVLIAQGDVPVYNIKIEYFDEDGNIIEETKSAQFIKDSNYDVSGFEAPEIDGYYYERSTPDDFTGIANSDMVFSSFYAKKKTIEIKANTDEVKYDGEYHELKGFETLTFTIGDETYIVEGINTETVNEKNEGEYLLNITGEPIIRNSAGKDVTYQFDITLIPGKLTILPEGKTTPEEKPDKNEPDKIKPANDRKDEEKNADSPLTGDSLYTIMTLSMAGCLFSAASVLMTEKLRKNKGKIKKEDCNA